MAGTTKLFYESPDLFEAEATVLAAEGPAEAPTLVLDRTIFYPEGGGQPWDLGSIGAPGEGSAPAQVTSVTERRGEQGGEVVLHALSGPLLPGGGAVAPGTRVRLSVDGSRRVDYMQQHSAEHLLGSIGLRLLGVHVVSVRFGPERSAIDFDLPAIPEDSVRAMEEAAEEAIVEDHRIRYRVCPPEDPAAFPLRRRPPAGEEVLRIVEIEGLDFSPCCGLHLGSTLGLRSVRILGTEKYKGMTRLYFVAGARAAADYRALARTVRSSAKVLGTSEAQLAEAVSREAARRKELEYALVGLERERAEGEAAAAPELAAGAGALAARRYADRGSGSLMTLAKALSDRGLVALLASLPDLTVQALAPEPSASLGERLGPLLLASGGKGGGGPANFRATFSDGDALEGFMAAAEAELGPGPAGVGGGR